MNPNELILSEAALAQLRRDGVAVLPNFVPAAMLAPMQRAFAVMLKRMRWNDFDGYEKTEPHRHMVQNVLTLEQGFVDAPLNPMVKAVLNAYLGPRYVLCEAKGWLSRPTREDFNGWHGDCWYDQNRVAGVPREVKLAIYLTDVRSGAFNYLKGSHGKRPRARVPNHEVERPGAEILEVTGPAGTGILFDTSGIHRQGVPILEPRQAVFYNFHDPEVPLQQEDVDYYRYHPLILNAAFLGGLSEEDQRILGFGNKSTYIPAYERQARHKAFQGTIRLAFEAKLRADRLAARVWDKARRSFSLPGRAARRQPAQ